MAVNQVGVTMVVDNAQLKKSFDEDIKLLQDMARQTDQYSKTAVQGARTAIDAQREYGKELGATAQQMRSLDAVSTQLETKVAGAGNRMATAAERGARGLSVMARQGTVTARSMNQLIASAADIAFAFGPEGAIISAVLMVSAGIAANMISSENKMAETARKFSEHVTDMLMDGTAKQLGRSAAEAYVHELEAESKMYADAQAAARTSYGLTDMAAQYKAHGLFGGGGADQEAAKKAKQDRAAALAAQKDVTYLEANNPRLEQLKKDRDRLAGEITRLTTKASELEGSGKRSELAETTRQLEAAKNGLSNAREETRKLEADRKGRFLTMAFGTNDPARRSALSERYTHEDVMDPGAEDSAQSVARADAASQAAITRAGARDQANARASAKRKADADRDARDRAAGEKRGNELMQQIEDAAVAHQMASAALTDQVEKARIDAEFNRRAMEIDQLKVSEDRKTQLLIAAATDRAYQVEAVERKSHERMRDMIAKEADEAAKQIATTQRKQVTMAEAEGRMLDQVARRMADELVKGREGLGKRLLAAAMEPEIKMLQGWAMSQFVQAASDFAIQNYVGGAEHMLAGAALETGAAALGSFAGASGGGGGSSGGGGGGTSSATHLGASGTNSAPQIIHVIIEHQDMNGNTIATQRQQQQRLEDRSVPIRIGALK